MNTRHSSVAYRFGDFVVDVTAFRVVRGDRPLHLEPKAVDVLLYLLQRPGILVSKQELIAAVWREAAVTENALTRVIAHLRRALEDPVDQSRYIETVPTRGYRFIAQPMALDGIGSAHGEAAALRGDRPRVRRAILAITASVVVTAAIATVAIVARRVAGVGAAVTHATARALPVRSLAVLPLKNLSGDPAQDYIADGMTQALGDTISRLGVLTVVSTTSSGRYRQASPTSTQIARELGADALLEGAVLRSADRVRVSVAVVDGSSGRRLWTNSYDRALADVLALYNEIALTAAGEIKAAVDYTNSSPRRSVKPDAYDAYLRGMFFLANRWMAGGCRDAERSLLRAIDRDPDFAPAYAALAWCYAYPDRLGRDIADVGPKAKAAVARALSLDDGLALAHLVAGTIKWRIDYDPVGGQTELRRALELDPNSALVLIPNAEFLLWRGNPDRAYPMLDRALALDPFSTDRNVGIGVNLLIAGRYEAAVADFSRALELDPHYLTARFWMAEAYGYLGERDRAVAEYLTWVDGALRPERAAAARESLQQAYARGGWTEFWRRELQLAEEEAAHPGSVWVPPYIRYTGFWYMARRYARLGEWDRALDALDRSYAGRHHLMATLTLEPLFAPLRSTARFRDLLRKTHALN